MIRDGFESQKKDWDSSLVTNMASFTVLSGGVLQNHGILEHLKTWKRDSMKKFSF